MRFTSRDARMYLHMHVSCCIVPSAHAKHNANEVKHHRQRRRDQEDPRVDDAHKEHNPNHRKRSLKAARHNTHAASNATTADLQKVKKRARQVVVQKRHILAEPVQNPPCHQSIDQQRYSNAQHQPYRLGLCQKTTRWSLSQRQTSGRAD